MHVINEEVLNILTLQFMKLYSFFHIKYNTFPLTKKATLSLLT